MSERVLKSIIFGATCLAWLIALAWLFSEGDFEPALTSALLTAAISALFIDWWFSPRQRRRELLRALVHELYVNARVLEDPKFSSDWEAPGDVQFAVYPRLQQSALNATIGSGVFHHGRDQVLVGLLHGWREFNAEFNQRLTLMEARTLLSPTKEELVAFRSALTEGQGLKQVKTSLVQLCDHLCESYAKESEFNKDTVLFNSDDGAA